MKQMFQDLRTGETRLVETPIIEGSDREVLIDSKVSLISPGTERMLVEFSKANLLEKALQQPEKIKQVLDKVASDGVLAAAEAVRARMAEPLRLGYSNVGVVRRQFSNVFKVGDRVVSNGPHADVVSVPPNLVAHIPENVNDESAAFTVLGSIGLQGVRLAAPSLGETFAVIGVGVIGLLTVQILRAHGCEVLAIDKNAERLKLAKNFGATTLDISDVDLLEKCNKISKGVGVDGAVICATSSSSEPLQLASEICRRRGRVVLVGVTGMELNRSTFYEKELTFQVSCSYGPGRYDLKYERGQIDYPEGFVRWTAKRNFEAILYLMSRKLIDVGPLISARYDFDEISGAYDSLTSDANLLGLLLEYTATDPQTDIQRLDLKQPTSSNLTSKPKVGVIGAGNFATRYLIPSILSGGGDIVGIASSKGLSATLAAKKFGIKSVFSCSDNILSDPAIDTIAIATRHDTHANLVCQALNAGKNVFVEKPLCLNLSELERIKEAHRNSEGMLMVGYNRRFAPLISDFMSRLKHMTGPKSFALCMNGGPIDESHWTLDSSEGGGRLIGEACHYIDLVQYLAGSYIENYQIVGVSNNQITKRGESVSINFKFSNGSIGSVRYLSDAGKALPKERIEASGGGSTLMLENFKLLKSYNLSGFRVKRVIKPDKGHSRCCAAFLDAIRNRNPSPIAFDDLVNTSKMTIEMTELINQAG